MGGRPIAHVQKAKLGTTFVENVENGASVIFVKVVKKDIFVA